MPAEICGLTTDLMLGPGQQHLGGGADLPLDLARLSNFAKTTLKCVRVARRLPNRWNRSSACTPPKSSVPDPTGEEVMR
eukprot:4198687-Pyramimonas_sp.AAC.1